MQYWTSSPIKCVTTNIPWSKFIAENLPSHFRYIQHCVGLSLVSGWNFCLRQQLWKSKCKYVCTCLQLVAVAALSFQFEIEEVIWDLSLADWRVWNICWSMSVFPAEQRGVRAMSCVLSVSVSLSPTDSQLLVSTNKWCTPQSFIIINPSPHNIRSENM